MRELHHTMRLGTWEDDRFNAVRTVYLAICRRMDALTGLVLDALRERGLYDATAVFFFSGHGDLTGDYSMVEKQRNSFAPKIINMSSGSMCRTSCTT